MAENIDLEVAAQAAWAGFRGRLADHVAAMADDEVLRVAYAAFVDVDEMAPHVEIHAMAGDVVQVEDSRGTLDLTCERRSADEVAVLVVGVLREEYAVPHPSFLAAEGLEVDPDAAVPAVAGIEPDGDLGGSDLDDLEGMPAGPEHLQMMVDAALGEMFVDLEHDDDGDIALIAGSSLTFVRVLAERPCIELYAEIVLDPEHLDRLPQELALLNDGHRLWKFADRDGLVVMTHEIVALPFSATGLRVLVRRFLDEVDQIAGDLAARVGGRRCLDQVPVEDERDLIMTGLLELLHLERVRTATVAGLFDHDRLEIIRQIVRIRSGHQSCADLDAEDVLTALRKALRLVSDGAAAGPVSAPSSRSRRRSVQEPLPGAAEVVGSDEALDLGWSA